MRSDQVSAAVQRPSAACPECLPPPPPPPPRGAPAAAKGLPPQLPPFHPISREGQPLPDLEEPASPAGQATMRIVIEGWDPEDRQPVRGALTGLDRAQTQAADLVTVELSSAAVDAAEAAAAAAARAEAPAPSAPAGAAAAAAASASAPATVVLKQNPAALRPGGVGGVRLGACAWDGAFVLAVYLDSQPAGSFAGLRAVELGAGMALPGLVLARLGAAVYVTDKPASAVFARVNAGKNRLLAAAPAPAPLVRGQPQAAAAAGQQQQQVAAPAPGSVAVLGLDWEDEASAAAITAGITAGGPVDLVVGTDCIYPDPNGTVPSSTHLLATICSLATPGRTRALLSFETRSDVLRQALLGAAAAAPLPCTVRQLPPEVLPEAYRAPHIELYELVF